MTHLGARVDLTRSIDTFLVSVWPRLLGYALRLTREPDTARDLMQQSALQALSARESPHDEKAALAWLFKVVRNVWIDQTRRRSVRSHEAIEDRSPATWSFDDELITTVAVRQALDALSPAERQVILLVDVEGHSYSEAAIILEVPTGTVMSRLHRARSRMLTSIAAEPARPSPREHR